MTLAENIHTSVLKNIKSIQILQKNKRSGTVIKFPTYFVACATMMVSVVVHEVVSLTFGHNGEWCG